MRLSFQLSIVLILAIPFSSCQKKCMNFAERIISKHKIVFTEPPEKIPVPHSVDAPMLGNGFSGVAISGTPDKQVYYLSRNDFWRLKSSYNESFPAVLGKLEIDIPGLIHALYLVEQDLYSAKTRSKFTKNNQEVRSKTFVAATEDLMVLEISFFGKGKLKGSVNLQLPGKKSLLISLLSI